MVAITSCLLDSPVSFVILSSAYRFFLLRRDNTTPRVPAAMVDDLNLHSQGSVNPSSESISVSCTSSGVNSKFCAHFLTICLGDSA
jgi:hypothetical protein